MDPATIGRSFPSNKSAKSLRCGRPTSRGKSVRRRASRRFSGAAKARGSRASPDARGSDYARFHGSPRPVLPFRLKPRQWPAIFFKKWRSSRNLGDRSSLSQSGIASQDAKAEMPTNYTGNDFVLIRLHPRRAQTISISVTTRERVGRSMSPMRRGAKETSR
jgi:hypothetical protein